MLISKILLISKLLAAATVSVTSLKSSTNPTVVVVTVTTKVIATTTSSSAWKPWSSNTPNSWSASSELTANTWSAPAAWTETSATSIAPWSAETTTSTKTSILLNTDPLTIVPASTISSSSTTTTSIDMFPTLIAASSDNAKQNQNGKSSFDMESLKLPSIIVASLCVLIGIVLYIFYRRAKQREKRAMLLDIPTTSKVVQGVFKVGQVTPHSPVDILSCAGSIHHEDSLGHSNSKLSSNPSLYKEEMHDDLYPLPHETGMQVNDKRFSWTKRASVVNFHQQKSADENVDLAIFSRTSTTTTSTNSEVSEMESQVMSVAATSQQTIERHYSWQRRSSLVQFRKVEK